MHETKSNRIGRFYLSGTGQLYRLKEDLKGLIYVCIRVYIYIYILCT